MNVSSQTPNMRAEIMYAEKLSHMSQPYALLHLMQRHTIHIADDLIETSTSLYGDVFFLSTDNAIGEALRTYGEFAEADNITLRRYLKPGDVCLDIGAHVGYMTLAMADAVGPSGAVVSFEPQFMLYKCLVANVLINGHGQVRALHAAVGETSGQMAFPQIDYRQPGNFGAVGAGRVVEKTLHVQVLTVDQLGLARCDLMKIDVEGMEPGVFAGAAKTIETFKPVLFFEANEQQNMPGILSMLDAHNYHHYWHASPFWRRNNFRGHSHNIYGTLDNPDSTRADLNILSLPPSRPWLDEMYPVTDPLEPKARIFENAVKFL